MTDSDAGRPIQYEDDVILSELQERRLTTTEIADSLGCHSETAKRRLKDLAERGLVESTKVGQVLLWQRTHHDQLLLVNIPGARQEEFIRGVRNTISVSREGIPESFIPDSIRNYGSVRGWPLSRETVTRNVDKIDSVYSGDLILFLYGSEVIAQGTLERVCFDPQVGEYLWPDIIGDSDVEYPITLLIDKYRDRSFSVDELYSASGSNREHNHNQDLAILSGELRASLTRKYGSVEESVAEIDGSGTSVLPLEEERAQSTLTNPDSDNIVVNASTGTGKTQELAVNSALQTLIPDIYDYSCAVCGSHRRAIAGDPEVEVAHILPLNKGGGYDVTNAMALCRLHHWAFDTGWISVDSNYLIMVRKAPETPGFDDFAPLAGDELNLPEEPSYWPDQENLRQHKELFDQSDWIIHDESN